MGFNAHFQQHMGHVAEDCRDGVCSGTNDLVEIGTTPDKQSGEQGTCNSLLHVRFGL
jgi:hypothetical protein